MKNISGKKYQARINYWRSPGIQSSRGGRRKLWSDQQYNAYKSVNSVLEACMVMPGFAAEVFYAFGEPELQGQYAEFYEEVERRRIVLENAMFRFTSTFDNGGHYNVPRAARLLEKNWKTWEKNINGTFDPVRFSRWSEYQRRIYAAAFGAWDKASAELYTLRNEILFDWLREHVK